MKRTFIHYRVLQHVAILSVRLLKKETLYSFPFTTGKLWGLAISLHSGKEKKDYFSSNFLIALG